MKTGTIIFLLLKAGKTQDAMLFIPIKIRFSTWRLQIDFAIALQQAERKERVLADYQGQRIEAFKLVRLSESGIISAVDSESLSEVIIPRYLTAVAD